MIMCMLEYKNKKTNNTVWSTVLTKTKTKPRT